MLLCTAMSIPKLVLKSFLNVLGCFAVFCFIACGKSPAPETPTPIVSGLAPQTDTVQAKTSFSPQEFKMEFSGGEKPPATIDISELKPGNIEWHRVKYEFRRIVRISQDTPFERIFTGQPGDPLKKIRFFIHPLSASLMITGYLGTEKLWENPVKVGRVGTLIGWGKIDIPFNDVVNKDFKLVIKPLHKTKKDILITEPIEIKPISPKRVPVIMVSLDTLRADHLPVYGYKRNTSPHLTEFAYSSVVFEDVTAPSPWTLPSHVTMLTGTDYHTHKVTNIEAEIPAGMPTLASLLADNGYVSEAITASGYVSRIYFPYFHAINEFVGGQDPKGDLKQNRPILMEWLKTHKDEAFFLFFHTYEVHAPYRGDRFAAGLDTSSHEYKVAQYDAGIYSADDALGEMFALLKQLHIYDSALIIVTSDHGEELGDRDKKWYGHGSNLYQEVINVPLIIKFPGQKRASQPLRVNEPVGLVDLVPTVLDVLKLPAPPVIDGKSLLATFDLATHKQRSAYPDRVFTIGAQFYMLDMAPRGMSALRRNKYKMIRLDNIRGDKYFPHKTELYDLQKDPFELHNLIKQTQNNQAPVIAADMMKVLWSVSRERIAPFKAAHMNRKVPESLRNRLRALGYHQ